MSYDRLTVWLPHNKHNNRNDLAQVAVTIFPFLNANIFPLYNLVLDWAPTQCYVLTVLVADNHTAGGRAGGQAGTQNYLDSLIKMKLERKFLHFCICLSVLELKMWNSKFHFLTNFKQKLFSIIWSEIIEGSEFIWISN